MSHAQRLRRPPAPLKSHPSDTALTKILTCHVVADELFSAEIAELLANGGVARITTVGGCEIEAQLAGGGVELTDENGGTAMVTIADVDQSNGVIHVVDLVLLPAM